MSRLIRGPLGFLAGWAERGLLAIGVLLRLLQSFNVLKGDMAVLSLIYKRNPYFDASFVTSA